MVRSFWQSKFIMGIMLALTLGVAIAVLIHPQTEVLYNPIVAALIVMALGCLSAWMLGNIVASKQCARVLRILHSDLDPEAFILAFGAVPGKLRGNSKSRAAANAYLADGYAAAGQFDRAIQALGLPCEPNGKRDPALSGAYYCAAARYALFSGDLEAADSALESLDYVTNRCCGDDVRLKYRMQTVYTFLQNLRSVVIGGKADEDWLQDQLRSGTYRIRELEILWVLASDALNRGDEKAAGHYLGKMKKSGGKTYFHAWAVEKLNKL